MLANGLNKRTCNAQNCFFFSYSFVRLFVCGDVVIGGVLFLDTC